MFVGFAFIPQEYLKDHPGSIDEDPGWPDLEEKWLKPKVPRCEIRVLLEEKRTRLAKEEELRKAEKVSRKRGHAAPKATQDTVANMKSNATSPLASPKTKVKEEKKHKKTPKQQLLSFPKSGRTGSWFTNVT